MIGVRGALLLAALLLISPLHGQDFPLELRALPAARPANLVERDQGEEPAPALAELVVPFSLLGRFVLPGTRMVLDLPVSGGGSDASTPVTVIHGARPGPVLCLAAGIHGDEINGVEIVRRVVNLLQAEQIAGTVVAVPVVNLSGFQRGTRYLPDRRDLNRYFPGSRYGSMASRIAHVFFDGVARHCDALIDFHTGSFDRSNLPQVRADLRLPAVLELARGLGATVVLHSPGSKGMLRLAATAAGIPALTFEVGAPARLQVSEIEVAVVAINGLLHHLGMIQGSTGDEVTQPIFYDSQWVRANAAGLLIGEVELGQRVQKGQRLGRVIDPIRNTERAIVSPVFGRVLGMAQNQQVLPGFAAFHLGEETSERHAVEEAVADTPESADEDGGRNGVETSARSEPDEDFE
ncbi:MAG: hypothetical protein CVV14_01575 [Gammaproteobacteria bacterium HGW-Gammaproteobacteria-4]|jgi:hypothetical protein|nr:MAG: hypothetical protein CVV14_01575 [Gammaproteobacteria bacterium HGW-Gammaproteobacteria-4]